MTRPRSACGAAPRDGRRQRHGNAALALALALAGPSRVLPPRRRATAGEA
jgi:hypothetical protein